MSADSEFDRVVAAYRAQGYEVVPRPGPDQLPPFARDFRVEIVGRRAGEGVLIAVRKDRFEVVMDRDMSRYAETTAAQPGWRFDLAVLEANSRSGDAAGVEESTEDELIRSLEQAAELGRMGFPRPAVVAAWAGLETAMRMRLLALGRGAGRLGDARQMLRELYSAGAILPDEFAQIEAASRLRDRIVHGYASRPADAATPESVSVQLLSHVARRLVAESATPAGAAV